MRNQLALQQGSMQIQPRRTHTKTSASVLGLSHARDTTTEGARSQAALKEQTPLDLLPSKCQFKGKGLG